VHSEVRSRLGLAKSSRFVYLDRMFKSFSGHHLMSLCRGMLVFCRAGRLPTLASSTTRAMDQRPLRPHFCDNLGSSCLLLVECIRLLRWLPAGLAALLHLGARDGCCWA
jgi:hypothetical protein